MKRLITLSLGDLQKRWIPVLRTVAGFGFSFVDPTFPASVDDGQTINLSRECVDENL